MTMMLDKNKSYLNSRDWSLYYINLDGQPERREYMENQFKYWEIEDYAGISTSMVEIWLGEHLKGKYPEMVTSGEIVCHLSP